MKCFSFLFTSQLNSPCFISILNTAGSAWAQGSSSLVKAPDPEPDPDGPTLLTLLCAVRLKRSWADMKRSTSRILAVTGEDRNTLAPASLKPTAWYTAVKGRRSAAGVTGRQAKPSSPELWASAVSYSPSSRSSSRLSSLSMAASGAAWSSWSSWSSTSCSVEDVGSWRRSMASTGSGAPGSPGGTGGRSNGGTGVSEVSKAGRWRAECSGSDADGGQEASGGRDMEGREDS
ncbi:hypothetical protein EYF80_055466 [Liparis tanakae]|uniref:Uncharacterized protein n=1 Tax=Liparis tanakae TaxID=230148 RepID=A0A4Z2F147_9TELE|nr:hypothetical protein EYF80_055466 [Liparis tanakae]